MLRFLETAEEREKKRVIRTKKKVARTRWLILGAGVKALYKEYGGLTQALRAMTDPTADGVFKKIDNAGFIGTLYILREVLPKLSTLSKIF